MVSPLVKQYWIASGLLMEFFANGMVMSYSSSLLPGLRAPDSSIQVDLETASWLASGLGIAMILGFAITPIFMDKFGRRWVFASASLVHIAAWLTIYCATNVTTLMLGRLIGGLAVAGIYCSGCTVVSEYTAPEVRGLVLNLKTVTLYCGYIYMHVAANYLNWRDIALLSATPCFISFLNNLTWPESPSWLVSKNRFEESKQNFYWLRGHDEKAVKEIESMIRSQKTQTTRKEKNVSLSQKVTSFFGNFKKKNFLQPLAIVFFIIVLCETSGTHFFPAYAVDIILEITNDKANALYYILGVDVVSLVSSIISCILIKMIGRKTLLFFSGITSTILIIAISLITLCISRGFNLIGGPWLVPSLVGIYFVLANLGCTAIPYVICAEIFPLAHREAGAGISGATMSFTFFVYLKVLPYLLTYLKLYGMFGIFSIGMTMSLCVLYFIMPETRNRSLIEIEMYFENGSFPDDEDEGSNVNDDSAKKLMLPQDHPALVSVVPDRLRF